MADISIKYIANNETVRTFVWAVFCEFVAPDYAPEGVKAFYKSIHDEDFLQQLGIYGAFLEAKMVGVIATRKADSHIALFFVDGKYQKQGIGRKLFETVKLNCNSEKMTVNASPYAVPIYTRLDFHQTEDEQIVSGIRFTPMEILLPQANLV